MFGALHLMVNPSPRLYCLSMETSLPGALSLFSLIVSPDTKIKEFIPHILNTNLRLRSFLGGNKMTVSSLTVKHLIENIDNIGYTKTEVNKYFTNIISQQPNLPTQNPVRTKCKFN